MSSYEDQEDLIRDEEFREIRKLFSHDYTPDILELLSEDRWRRREMSQVLDCHQATVYRHVDRLEELGLAEEVNSFSDLHQPDSDNRVKRFHEITDTGEKYLESYNSLLESVDSEKESVNHILRTDNAFYLLNTIGSKPCAESEITEALAESNVEMSPRTVGRHLEALYDLGLINTSSAERMKGSYELTDEGEALIDGIYNLYSVDSPVTAESNLD